MKVTVAGYNCKVTEKKPKPVEVRVFEGEETVVEAEVVAFASRFVWYSFIKVEGN